LQECGYHHPNGNCRANGKRVMIEVYPHPALIVLFNLAERLKYKKGSVADKRKGLRTLGNFLRQLAQAQPRLAGTDTVVRDPCNLCGRHLKSCEDLLDATVCCYLALHTLSCNGSRNEMIGNSEWGYIVNPSQPLRVGAA
jgi:predicted RNase H-like nuclease